MTFKPNTAFITAFLVILLNIYRFSTDACFTKCFFNKILHNFDLSKGYFHASSAFCVLSWMFEKLLLLIPFLVLLNYEHLQLYSWLYLRLYRILLLTFKKNIYKSYKQTKTNQKHTNGEASELQISIEIIYFTSTILYDLHRVILAVGSLLHPTNH